MGSLFSFTQPNYSPVTFSTPDTDGGKVGTQQNEVSPRDTSPADTNTQQNSETQTAEEDAVKDIIRKSTRARNSTIQTSYRGVLEETSNGNGGSSLAPQRKSLLGE